MTTESILPIPFSALGLPIEYIAPYGQLELPEAPISREQEEQAVNAIQGKIIPVIKALSCPEVISKDSTFTIEKGVMRRNSNLWRYILEYSAKMGDFDYWLQAYHVEGDGQASVATVIDATTYAPDEIRVVSINNEAIGLPKIKLGDKFVQTTKDLEYVFRVVDFLAEDAPKQALAKGRISRHWMDRFNWQSTSDWPLDENQEGYPVNLNKTNGKPNIYELILWNGLRTVAHIDTSSDQRNWVEDVHGDTTYPEQRVIAWRELGIQIPDYYSKEKYPRLHRA